MEFEKTQFRIRRKFMCYLQFKTEHKVLGIRFSLWRYLPDHFVAGVFSIWMCPIYLPMSTSHCYVGGSGSKNVEKKLSEIKSKYSTLEEYLNKLKSDKKKYYQTKYL